MATVTIAISVAQRAVKKFRSSLKTVSVHEHSSRVMKDNSESFSTSLEQSASVGIPEVGEASHSVKASVSDSWQRISDLSVSSKTEAVFESSNELEFQDGTTQIYAVMKTTINIDGRAAVVRDEVHLGSGRVDEKRPWSEIEPTYLKKAWRDLVGMPPPDMNFITFNVAFDIATTKLSPRFDGKYKIFSDKYGPLFCGDSTDSQGDHRVWIEPRSDYENGGKERWEIVQQPESDEKRQYFKIFNVKWGGPLFCGDSTDSAGDHNIWVESRHSYENGGKERWEIEEQSDGTYKIFNVKWGSPLFCGDSTDSAGDHKAWGEPRHSYENNGKERWTLKRV